MAHSRWRSLRCCRQGAPSTPWIVTKLRSVLLPAAFGESRISAHLGDFTQQPWPFDSLDGILMANSLHYVRHQRAFIQNCASRLRARHRILIVEYDQRRRNPWVPYPLDRNSADQLFRNAGYSSVSILGTRPSRYQRGSLYAMLAETVPEVPE